MQDKRKVLVVDDDARYLELVKFMLEDAGYDVSTETDARRVPHRIASSRPDALVTDVLMPGMDGVELGRLLRMDNETSALPIVYVSAWTGAPEGELPSGAVRLMKPFSPTQLIDAIETAIDKLNDEEARGVTSD